MDAHQFDSLTPTERRVLRLVHHSRKSEAIAALAGMSRHTVDQHIKSARAKLGNVGRYVAADMLRAFEEAHPPSQEREPASMPDTPPALDAHPLSQGSGPRGMDEPAGSAPQFAMPDRREEPRIVAERPAMPCGFDWSHQSGGDEHLERWLQERSILSRFVLVLVAAFLLLLLIISAPLLAKQMGRIGRLIYQ
jgi:DNA-binding CsgD family transcriptional regulator